MTFPRDGDRHHGMDSCVDTGSPMGKLLSQVGVEDGSD